MTARFAVVIFPGSNCDHDTLRAIRALPGCAADPVWHTETSLDGYDCIVLPGGFSYGDYLRCGALARFSPVMRAVAGAAAEGRLVIGICNGFQVLTEAGLLPGALRRNDHLAFRCEIVDVRVDQPGTAFTGMCHEGQVLRLPIAHGEGNYFADPDMLAELRRQGQVVLRYANANPNGSVDDIAGIVNADGNVFGLMPHPERAMTTLLGSADGLPIWQSVLATLGVEWHLDAGIDTVGAMHA